MMRKRREKNAFGEKVIKLENPVVSSSFIANLPRLLCTGMRTHFVSLKKNIEVTPFYFTFTLLEWYDGALGANECQVFDKLKEITHKTYLHISKLFYTYLLYCHSPWSFHHHRDQQRIKIWMVMWWWCSFVFICLTSFKMITSMIMQLWSWKRPTHIHIFFRLAVIVYTHKQQVP